MMRGTAFQWFWRWLVAFESIVFIVADVHVFLAWSAFHAIGALRLANLQESLYVGSGAVAWLIAALLAKALLLVCVPMLVLVELVAWARRSAKRRLLRHPKRELSEGWYDEDSKNG